MRSFFYNRNFFLLWQGQLVSQLGSQAFLVATMYWTMEATGSASLMGVVMMLSTLPTVLLSPIGGTVADWYSRRTIIIISDVLSGISVLSLAGLMSLRPETTDPVVVWLCGVVVLGGVIRAFFQPAISAAIPDLVSGDQVAPANALMQLSGQASSFIGLGVGGVLYRVVGAPLLFLIDGLSYLFSACSEAFIRLPVAGRAREETVRDTFKTFRADTLTGLKYVWQRRGMRVLLLAASMVNFFVMPIFVLLPFYVELQLGAGVAWYGFLLAALSAGSIAGSLLAGAVQVSGARRSATLIGAYLGTSVLIGSLSVVHSPVVAAGCLFGVGGLSGFINIHAITLFQVRTPQELRGRVMSLVITLAGAITPLGMLLGGIVGDLTSKNLPLIYGAGGLGAVLMVLIIAFNSDFRAFVAGE